MLSSLVLLSTCLGLANAFYLPGVAPTDYDPDQQVPLFVNTITPGYSDSDVGHSHSREIFSYDYYNEILNFCRPEGGPKSQSESIGSILFGDRIYNSPFELFMLKNETCKTLCKTQNSVVTNSFLLGTIFANYQMNWIVDGLPASGVKYQDSQTGEPFYSVGFPLGEVADDNVYLHNHYDINIEYHQSTNGKYRVVGVLVSPKSMAKNAKSCDSEEKFLLKADDKTDVTYTYSVIWTESPNIWATRWDKYLHVFNPSIHWFSLINSATIAVFLVGLVATILLRGVRKDISQYNEIDLNEEVQEDSGWKLIHGDVFRAPSHKLLLSVFLGSGAQLIVMSGITLSFSLLGLLSPSNRGSLTTVVLILYIFLGSIGGYTSATFYKTFGGESFKLLAIVTPLLAPGIIFAVFLLLNFFLIFTHSSGAVPFGTMLATVLIWFVISVPLSCVGSFVAFKKDPFKFPVRTNQIPRQIPQQPKSLNKITSTLLAGILPFGAISVELYYIYNSLWLNKLYYMFGFLFVYYGLMLLTTSAVTVLLTYFLLKNENYHWQWRSFVAAGASSFYIFLYALVYLYRSLQLKSFASYAIYIGYSLLISFIMFILTGSVGFLSSFFFTRRIYSEIKVD
ncbi:hypothetical protein DV495_003730 [Geotrichum candidum]|nr:hypothetical protein DV495_003730 [Geotrichum candidum]